MNVGFISLGCSKNLIDTEATIGMFKENNYKIVNDELDADVIVINTCGFIDSAKEEAINTILEMVEYKKKRCKYLIVMGCLVQRYYDDLIKLLPEVDLFIKIDEYDSLWKKIDKLVRENVAEETKTKAINKISEIPQMPMFLQEQFLNRMITTGKNFAYLKIGEGCSNKCTYCAIPYIRGPFISRKEDDIIEEAKQLAKKGISELIIIAQDTTKYGVDIYGESKLAELIEKISKIKEIKWIRFLYSHPEGITDELIETIKTESKICHYLDIPIQSGCDKILKRMGRRTNREQITGLIEKLREEIPDICIRTTFITGFPGETEEDHEETMEFVNAMEFDRLGAFAYSQEEDTPAAELPEQVEEETKLRRQEEMMELQQEIAFEAAEEMTGKVLTVMVEGKIADDDAYVTRTYKDAPGVDGYLFVRTGRSLMSGDFITVKVTGSHEYDLMGEPVEE